MESYTHMREPGAAATRQMSKWSHERALHSPIAPPQSTDLRYSALERQLKIGSPIEMKRAILKRTAIRQRGSRSANLDNYIRVHLAAKSRAREELLDQASPGLRIPGRTQQAFNDANGSVNRELRKIAMRRRAPSPERAEVELASTAVHMARRIARMQRPELEIDEKYMIEGGYDRLGLNGGAPSSPIALQAAIAETTESASRLEHENRRLKESYSHTDKLVRATRALERTGDLRTAETILSGPRVPLDGGTWSPRTTGSSRRRADSPWRSGSPSLHYVSAQSSKIVVASDMPSITQKQAVARQRTAGVASQIEAFASEAQGLPDTALDSDSDEETRLPSAEELRAKEEARAAQRQVPKVALVALKRAVWQPATLQAMRQTVQVDVPKAKGIGLLSHL